MHYLSKNISILVLITFLFIEFLSCKIPNSSQQVSPSNTETANTNITQVSDYSIVTDPNGIAFYKSPMDLKSKSGILSSGAKYEYTSVVKQEPDAYDTWKEIIHEGNNVWIIWNPILEDRLVLNFSNHISNETPLELGYVLTEKEMSILEFPFADAKQIEKVNSFTILKSSYYAEQRSHFKGYHEVDYSNPRKATWYEVITESGNKGYINDVNAAFYSEAQEAKSAANDKRIQKGGFLKLKNPKPKLYFGDTLETFSSKVKIRFSKFIQEFDIHSSLEKSGVRYYQLKNIESLIKEEIIRITHNGKPFPWKESDNNLDFYISEKDGIFYTEMEASRNTIENTSFKGDRSAIRVMQREYEENSLFLNYSKFKLKQIPNKLSDGDTYYIATAYLYLGHTPSNDEFDEANRRMILRRDKGVYKAVSSNLVSSIPLRILDLDKDGVYEIVTEEHWRMVNKRIIYGIKEGETNYSIITPPHGNDIGAIDLNKGLIIAGNGLDVALKGNLKKGQYFNTAKENLFPLI
ncbi:MAG: hypothetical protein KBA66_03365 [Leptospiraceae bacterium]|nr:hypothetical protein [Leptospiraceae bacterium]